MQFSIKTIIFVAALAATNVAAAPAPAPVAVAAPAKVAAVNNACYYKRDEDGEFIGYKRSEDGLMERDPAGCAVA